MSRSASKYSWPIMCVFEIEEQRKLEITFKHHDMVDGKAQNRTYQCSQDWSQCDAYLAML